MDARRGYLVPAVLGAIIVAALNGCATTSHAEVAAQSMHDQSEQIVWELNDCLSHASEFPEYSVLGAHLPKKFPTLEQLTDEHMATDEEAHAMSISHQLSEPCRQRELTEIMPVTPSIAGILVRSYRTREDYVIDLVQKRSTWGQYIRNIRDLNGDTNQQVDQEWRRIMSGYEQSRADELNRRAAAVSAFSDYMQRQQAINAMNSPAITVPKVTTCNAYGSTATCVTQ